jgi:hypothetical protein
MQNVRQHFYVQQNFKFPKLIQVEIWELHWKFQEVSKFWYSSVDLHMCALGGPTDVQTLLHF